MIVRITTIRNRLGLHARAASRLVQLSQEFAADIKLANGEHLANGKSIMSVLLLQATKGTELEVHAEGDDELSAIEAIVTLIEDRFGEED